MASISLQHVLDHLRRLHGRADAAQRSDRELLHAFATSHDQDAFAVVMRRHAALVWSVCRRILGHQQDAEDAFQATFVILARRACSTRWRPSVGGWLHTVAQRLAVRARQQAEQRRLHEREASRTPPVDSSLGELAAVVDEELQRLPDKYREPLLLHYWEGMTAEAAARQLGLSRSTFYNRLAYGRELLRERLSRQGLSLAAPLLIAALAPEAEAASRSLIQATLRGVMGSVPQRVAALAAEALGVTTALKLKIGMALALLLGIAAGGMAIRTPQTPRTPTPPAERPADHPKTADKPARRVDRHGDPLPSGAVARLGTLRFRLDTHRVEQLAFAPLGKTLAVVSSCGLTLFDAASGKATKTIKLADTDFTRLAYSPDGKRLMTYGVIRSHVVPGKRVVQTWDVADGRKLSEWELPYVCWLAWSSDGQPRAACLGKEEIIYQELATGRKLRLAAKHLHDRHLVGFCCCVAANNLLAASGANGAIHIWDLSSGKERCTLQPGVFVSSLALSADGRRLASVCRDAANNHLGQMWDTTTGKLVRTFLPGSAVHFAPDGKTLVTKRRTEILFWDAASGRQRSRIRTDSYGFSEAVAFTPDGKSLATAEDHSGGIQLWNVADGTPRPQPPGHSDPPNQAAFSPDGKRVATCGTSDGTIRLWDSATGEPLLRMHHSGWARDTAFSADGRTLYSCWTDDKLYFDDAASGRQLQVRKVDDADHPKWQPSGLGLHLSDDRRRLTVFHSGDEWAREMLVTVWDTATGKLLLRRRRVEDAFWNALSADGRTLAAAHAGPPFGRGQPGRDMGEGPMYLEDLTRGETLLTFPTLAGQTVPMAFAPDGRLLLSYTYNPGKSGPRGITLRVWEVLTAAELRTFPTSFQPKAAFTPDGRLLAMPTARKEILVWNLVQAKEHQRFHDFKANVRSLAFSPDGRRLVSGLSDSTLLVWDVAAPSAAGINKRGAEEAAKAWADLAGKDAPRAFRARGMLASVPAEALPLLSKHLHPARSADPRHLRQLLADLESEQFTVRQKAQEELQNLGDLAEPALRRTLANKPTLEVRRRVQTLLERLRGPVTQPELLQALRAVAVLEDIDTPEARRLLENLANGAPEARLTREAKEALRRLQLRK